jgi:hypothetical protein
MAKARRKKKTDTSDFTPTEGKKALWKIFSVFIRLRDCLETTGTLTHGKCCTCGRKYPMKKLQAGHFIPGRMDSILFDPTCVHSQCYKCNIERQGEWLKYWRFMEVKYGRPYILELMDRAEDDCEITVEWELTTAAYYLEQIQEMRYGSERPKG